MAIQQIKSTFDLTKFIPKIATSSRNNPEKNSYLVVAPPGWGKSELVSTFPDSVFLACEGGHKFISAYKIIIDCWDYLGKEKEPWKDDDGNIHMSYIQAIALLIGENMRGKFKFVVTDTVDSLVKMCLDYHYTKAGVEHAKELGDYGEGWDKAQNSPIRRAFNALMQTGRGMAFTTHESITDFETKTGKVKKKKETTLPAGVFRLLNGQCDYILHGMLGIARNGNLRNDRIVVTENSEDMLAKNREGTLPPAYIVEPDINKRWAQFKGFFESDGKKSKAAFDEFKKHYEL